MAWIAALAALAGTAASTYGASQSARSANSAASEARNFNVDEIARQRGNLGATMFGANNWAGLMDPEGNYSGDPSKTGKVPIDPRHPDYGTKDRPNYYSRQSLGAQDQFTKMLGGNFYDQFKGLNTDAAAMSAKVPGMYDAETAKLMGSAQDYTGRIGNMYSKGSNALLGAYDKGAGGLMRMQDSFGQARDKTIRRDSENQLMGMNDRTRATLAASGFGNSTALPNALNANATQAGYQRDAALTDLTGQKTALGRSLLGERAGMGKDLFGQSAAALERAMGAEQSLGQSRSDNSFNLKQADIKNQLQYKSAPLSFAWNALTGPNLAPYGDQSGSLPVPGYSPTGIAASTAGNATAGMASMLMMQKLMGKQGADTSGWG